MKNCLLVLIGFVVGTQVVIPQSAAQTSDCMDCHESIAAPTQREMIEILADYDLRHLDAPSTVPFYGMSDLDSRIIWVMNNTDFVTKRKVVIHEFTHIALHMRGIPDDDDDAIKATAEAEYKRIFGKP